MKFKINENKLKIKYVLGNYKIFDDYPTSEDIMYYLIQWMMGQDKNSDFVFHNLWLMNELELDKNDEKKKDELIKKLNNLVKEEYLLFNKETNTRKYYKIEKNPFE